MRTLPGPRHIDFFGKFFGEVVAVRILDDPREFAKPNDRQSPRCAVCGSDTEVANRLAVTLSVRFVREGKSSSVLFQSFAHPTCFEKCVPTREPGVMPW